MRRAVDLQSKCIKSNFLFVISTVVVVVIVATSPPPAAIVTTSIAMKERDWNSTKHDVRPLRNPYHEQNTGTLPYPRRCLTAHYKSKTFVDPSQPTKRHSHDAAIACRGMFRTNLLLVFNHRFTPNDITQRQHGSLSCIAQVGVLKIVTYIAVVSSLAIRFRECRSLKGVSAGHLHEIAYSLSSSQFPAAKARYVERLIIALPAVGKSWHILLWSTCQVHHREAECTLLLSPFFWTFQQWAARAPGMMYYRPLAN